MNINHILPLSHSDSFPQAIHASFVIYNIGPCFAVK